LLASLAMFAAANGNAAAPKGRDFGTRIANADAEPHNWLSHGRTYDEARFSPLTQIHERNVRRLGLAWYYDLDTNRGQEATPLVVDGRMYTTSAWSKVQAFNAVTGELLWQFDPKVPGAAAVKACCDVVNRGVAFWNGKVFVGTLDGRLIALNAKSGHQVWSVATVDSNLSYTITGAPRVVKGKIIIGNAGAEFGVRGYVSAYDAASGRLVWRFYTVPGEPGHPDHAASDAILAKLAVPTWRGEWWSEKGGRGGGTVWDSMAYDPALDLLYIGVGNAAYWNQSIRSPGGGDNLFVSSILALRPDTGEYVWHYQEVPGDEWDYTASQHMILADIAIDGQRRKVLMQAPKNGFFYVLDRETGKLISAKPYTPVNWALRIDADTGRPEFNPDARYSSTGKMWLGRPGMLGGHNWQPMAFSPISGLVYIPTLEIPGAYKNDAAFRPIAKGMNVGVDMSIFVPSEDKAARDTIKKSLTGELIAWDPKRQAEVWRVNLGGPWNGGVLATAGGLVFEGDGDGMLSAYAASTGAKLWSFDSHDSIEAPPISFSVNGTQYLTVMVGLGGGPPLNAGELLWGANGPRHNRSRVLTFALGGRAKLPVESIAAVTLAQPAQSASPEAIKSGEQAYHHVCFLCHGSGAVSSGLLPDLRHSGALGSAQAWRAIVYGGALIDKGMVSFKEDFSEAEVEQLRAYVISRAQVEAKSASLQ
jgi:quinohemoprotein ethanol dehydrogenase